MFRRRRIQLSRQQKKAGLIEKETLKKRISNVEVMYSVYFKKRLSEATPSFEILRFDIRYSAVRCYIHM